MTYRVLIADDQPLVRAALRELIDQADDLRLVGEAADGRDAIEQAMTLRPDVVLMDIRMPELDGIAATRTICSNPDLRAVRVLILTTFDDDENVLLALRAGAGGFIGKGTEPDDLIRAITTIAEGEGLLSPSATRSLIDRIAAAPSPSSASPQAELLLTLTPREREILVEVARGRSNQEIAHALYLSVLTVKTHLNHAMTKLAAHDRAQLVIVAYENGLILPGL